MRKTHIMALAAAAAAIVLAIGAVAAYGSLATDATPPHTTTNVSADPYWDDAVITIAATDDEGIAYIYHELDNGVVRLTTVEGQPLTASVEDAPLSFTSEANPTPHHVNAGAGTHTLKYWAQDINGNVEAQNTVTFTIIADNVKPRTSATAVSVRRYRTVRLRYKVSDSEPNKGTATVKIKIKNRNGKTVKTIKAGKKPVNTALTQKVRCTFRRGVYRYYVYATDASGNAQAKVGSARLTVK